jgi:hypothetical protein
MSPIKCLRNKEDAGYRTIIFDDFEWQGHVGENRNAYRILVGMPDGKRPLGRPRLRWVDNIKDGMEWIGLIWLRIGTSGGLL